MSDVIIDMFAMKITIDDLYRSRYHNLTGGEGFIKLGSLIEANEGIERPGGRVLECQT